MNKRSGLTLLEVILSITILAIVVVIFLGIQTFSLTTTRSAADTHELVRAAEAVVEQVTGEYISGEAVRSDDINGVKVVIERCEYNGEEIRCRDLADPPASEVGIFITATATSESNNLKESLYRFVRLP